MFCSWACSPWQQPDADLNLRRRWRVVCLIFWQRWIAHSGTWHSLGSFLVCLSCVEMRFAMTDYCEAPSALKLNHGHARWIITLWAQSFSRKNVLLFPLVSKKLRVFLLGRTAHSLFSHFIFLYFCQQLKLQLLYLKFTYNIWTS